jgi:putative membrane protein
MLERWQTGGVRTTVSPPRWPRWVYGSGSEPDVRFSLANERTFLAWIRTALALLAAGVALDGLDLSLPDRTQHVLAVLMVALGMLCAIASWVRWARAEHALRRTMPLPGLGSGSLLAVGVLVASVVLLGSL